MVYVEPEPEPELGGGEKKFGLGLGVMSFGSVFDSAMQMQMLPYATSASASKPLFTSPALSLTLQSNLDGGHAQRRDSNATMPLPLPLGVGGTAADDNDSRSAGSDHLDALSADDLDLDPPPSATTNSRKRKKRYHRHTPQQIQELEALFKECPHPDEKQRAGLSKRLCLETRQVKFWFQNRRTQMKMQMERHENTLLRQDNDRLRAENLAIKDSMRNPICNHCSGPAMLSQISLEEQHLRMENARLKDELTRVCALAGKLLGKPLSSSSMSPPLPLPMPNSSLDLAVGTNAFPTPLPPLNDFPNPNNVSSPLGTVITPGRAATAVDKSIERSVLLDLALSAIDELVKMAQMEEPLWIPCLQSNKDTLNYEEYLRSFNNRRIGVEPVGFVSEATRETGVVIINSMALIETLMDSARWSEMFSCVIASATTTEVLSSGMGGSRNGALQLMRAEFQVLSPLVPIRDVNFLRFCKQLTEGCWAVVDVSIDDIRENASALADNMKCRRLPSGCLVQDLPNGYCKVTWVEHVEYDEAAVHQLYRPILQSGLALGAHRWLATLQRQCECLAILMSSSAPTTDSTTITASGKRSMLKLAQRMTDNFCAGVCASSAHKWSKLVGAGNVGEDVKVMTRQSVDEPGEPPGVVLSAATSVWVPVAPQRLFDFLRDERLRSEWDILSNGGPMQEMAHIAKGQHHGNSVSLLRASAVNSNQSSMLILQETCTDPSGSMVVYAPVDIPAMHLVMSGGDSTYVALLPSGFAILPDGPVVSEGSTAADAETKVGGSGSLLTVAFQILVNSQPTAKLTVESVETVNNLISCTIQKIKVALSCDV